MKHRAEVNKELLAPGDRVRIRDLKYTVRLTRRWGRTPRGNPVWAGTYMRGERRYNIMFSAARVRRIVSYIEQTGW